MTTARPLAALALLLFALPAAADELRIRPRTAEVGEAVQIELTLDGDLAKLDSVDIPVSNLRIEGSPSVSSEFQWINGVVSRRKVLRYPARTLAPGPASAGPLTLPDEQGGRTRIPAATIDVIAAADASASTPEEMLDQLERGSKEVLFVFGELDSPRVYAGQQVIATWYLYSAEPVRDLDIAQKPELQDFFAEELPITEQQSVGVMVGERVMRKIPIRRVALFPLRPGNLTIGRFEAVAEVVQPIENPLGGLSIFEGRIVNVRRRSPAMQVEVMPLPGGTAPDAVGGFLMTCGPPAVPPVGPVSIEVKVSGSGNLRAARPPHFAGPVDATIDVQDAGLNVRRDGAAISMDRKWKILLFPQRDGLLLIPPLVFEFFEPDSATRKTAQCPGSTVAVKKSAPPAPKAAGRPRRARGGSATRDYRMAALVAGAVVLLLLLVLLMRRSGPRYDRDDLRSILEAKGDARELRRRIDEAVQRHGREPAALLTERSDAGDAFRALVSWVDIQARETLTHKPSERELRTRAVALLQML